MKEIEIRTSKCVNFQFWNNDIGQPDHININWEKAGCSSPVGRRGGRQLLNLEAPQCFLDRNIIVRQLLHAMGFYPEQGRSDRDEYVEINWWNIQDGQVFNFEKYDTVDYGVPYDYTSIMHFKCDAFAIDPSQYTVHSKKPEGNDAYAQSERKRITESFGLGGLSDGDILQIRRFYGRTQFLETQNTPRTLKERTRFCPGAEAIFLEGRSNTLKLQPSFNKFFRQIILTSAICTGIHFAQTSPV
ncbi:unnamed protein product [Allacma fusca]|uniref:Peptidase M12A domain-containing protein n=1 Tax=Allacma fusca TaxID=39272 RepID=A0A8J2IZY6_9HEXA|nr:unnamed protein product [Allacma fusca]